jgi:hypothetical protein
VTVVARLASGEHSIEITVRGYSHPNLTDEVEPVTDDLDANWLQVNVTATDGVNSWIDDGEVLCTWEVLGLAEWFEAVASGQFPNHGTVNIEYTPAFELSNDRKAIEVTVHACSDELGGTQDRARRWGALRFPIDPEALRRFAAELRRDVAPFPVRAVELNGAASWPRKLGAIDG